MRRPQRAVLVLRPAMAPADHGRLSMITKEQLAMIVLGLAGLLMVVCIVMVLSHLTKERLGILGSLRETLANNSTYATTAIAIGTELYNAYRYDTGVNWVLVLTLLGITTTAAKIGRAQDSLKTNTQATENTAASVDLVLNTMPVGPKNPVASTRTQVNQDVTPRHPSSPPAPVWVAPQQPPQPGSIL